MASPSTSSSPSSSAVTLPRPGKSILKRPPPPQQSFFSLSRLSRLLPSQAPSPTPPSPNPAAPNAPGETELKRAHFFLPHLVTVYPISSANPPCGPNVKEEKKSIDVREAERRRRIVRGNSYGPGSPETEEWWSPDKVDSFYRECCVGREEEPHAGISAALKRATGDSGRALDLSGVQLTPGQAATLSDVFAVEWGLRKLFLKECDLDESILKLLLHALLIPGTLNFLSIASNRRLKAPAFRIVGVFMKRAKNLQFLDVSQNSLDKKSVEYIGASLKPANEAGLISLRLDDCQLRPAALEALAQAVRTSSLRNISLRHNRISASGAVALALMIKDYPDTMPSYSVPSSAASSPTASSTTLFGSALSPPATPTTASPPPTPTRGADLLPSLSRATGPRDGTGVLPPPPRILPPPLHPSVAGAAQMQTTYTPYIPRARRGAGSGTAAGVSTGVAAGATARDVQRATLSPNPLSATGRPVPVITSSARGGITTRHPVAPVPLSPSFPPAHFGAGQAGNTSPLPPGVPQRSHGPSAALLDKVRALDSLPRLGELRTLDLRGNDIRNGINYIAQVLKRNRTLKVLNLSENKIDVQGLVAIAEALKYNLTLETLDLNRNPCSGPPLEGIQSLRTAFTLNTSLKRLFLSSTSMTSSGAIALAEFLPESASLLHLDLTNNNLDLAGIMALSGGLKANHTMRCLDVNIPPDDEEFARMCRDILNTCVRNTEEAEKTAQTASSGRGSGKGVWGMIEESELAKRFKKVDQKIPVGDVVAQARDCEGQLRERIGMPDTSSPPIPNGHAPAESHPVDPELIDRSEAVSAALVDVIQATADPARMEELLVLNDSLTSLISQASQMAESAAQNGNAVNGAGDGASLLSMVSDSTGDSSAVPSASEGAAVTVPTNGALGLTLQIPVDDQADQALSEDEGMPEPDTPRIDKGKQRAEPEPEVHEPVLSPSFRISASDDEDEDGPKVFVTEEPDPMLSGPSPTDISRSWVAEEGEVFRKGTVLLGPEEMEGDYDGEELRVELLEAEVERPPPRALNVDEFGIELSTPLPLTPAFDGDEPPPSMMTPIDEAPKSFPRPYLRRARSSSSSTLQGSPTVAMSGNEEALKLATESKDIVGPLPNSPTVSSPLSPSPFPGSGHPMPYLPRRRSSSSLSNAPTGTGGQ